jgi:hypothetical protein
MPFFGQQDERLHAPQKLPTRLFDPLTPAFIVRPIPGKKK